MRRFWRIAKRDYALSTDCTGSRLIGGRWNRPGFGALYAASTIELAALEKLVHTAGLPPSDLLLVAVDVPDDATLMRHVDLHALPDGWNALPSSDAAQAFETQWLERGAALVLLVPSVIVPESLNAVINPLHPRYREVVLTRIREFHFDPRLPSSPRPAGGSRGASRSSGPTDGST